MTQPRHTAAGGSSATSSVPLPKRRAKAMNKITVYSTRYCAYCVRAKALLNQNGLAYEEVVLDDPSLDARAELERLTGGHTFPQIVIDGVTVGGYSELVPFVRAA
jgi:glutaredoxin 3